MTEDGQIIASGGDDGRSYERGQVLKIINSVIDRVHEADGLCVDTLRAQLQDLRSTIEDARRSMGVSQAPDIKNKHIQTASDELDEVVRATEHATGTIMDSCEAIQGHFDAMGSETAAVVEEEITKIYEACTFQDITGQRITNVIKALQEIESKVAALMDVVGGTTLADEKSESAEEVESQPLTDEDLLNGPQMADQAISQDEIDRLLAEFD